MLAIRTLVVDDDFMVARVHQGYTERLAGFEVVGAAHSGREALDAVARLRPDLLVLDVYLPDLPGLEVVRELRRRGEPVDVILVTAAKDAETLQEAMRAGVLHYIIKPFGFERYARTLHSYLDFRRKRASDRPLEQEDVDQLFALVGRGPRETLPKGLNRPTLDLVTGDLRTHSGPRSAWQVAGSLGISRSTARRYLEYLHSQGRAVLDLRYGTTGRPEHRYRLVSVEP